MFLGDRLQTLLKGLSCIENHENMEALTVKTESKKFAKCVSASFEKSQDSVLEMLIDAGITERKLESLSLKEMSSNDLSKISGGISNTKRNAALLAAFLNLNSMAGSYAQNPITITKKPENNISSHTIAHNKEDGKRNTRAEHRYSRILSVLSAILGIGGGCLALHKQRTGQKLKAENNKLRQDKDSLGKTIMQLRRQNHALKQEEIDYSKIQEAINNPANSSLTAANVKQLQELYRGNERFKEPLERLERKIRRRTNSTSINDRKILIGLADKAPAQTKNPDDQYSGVYLWEKGYTVESFLGKGGCGCVWKCKSKTELSGYKAMKIISPNSLDPQHKIEMTKTVATILNHDKTGKAKRYLPNLRVVSRGSDYIIRSPLADGDLWEVFDKENQIQPQRPNFDETLRYAGQMLKSVKVLHDAGYTHNDIKPNNFLRISNWSGKKENDAIKDRINKIIASTKLPCEKINEILSIPLIYTFSKRLAIILRDLATDDATKLEQISQFITWKKSHTHKLQLTDFDTLGRLGYESHAFDDGKFHLLAEWPYASTPGFLCREDAKSLTSHKLWFNYKNTDSKHAIKRDVYALGVTLMWLLIRYSSSSPADLTKAVADLQACSQNPDEGADKFYTTHEQSLTRYNTPKTHLIKFIALIKKMVNPDIFERITLDGALAELQQIKVSSHLSTTVGV